MKLDAKPLAALEAPTSRASHADCGRYWATAQTHPQAERWAAQCLTRRGYHVYLPMLIVQRRDRTIPSLLHRLELPLFSSYLFIQLGNTDPWTPARYTDGIRQLLMSGSKPHKLPEAVMDALRAGDAFRRLPLPDAPLLRPGAPVTCLYGPFQGREAVVISAATNTARIALPMLGAMRELVVPIACLTARD